MAKRRREDLIAGQPLRPVLEFLCREFQLHESGVRPNEDGRFDRLSLRLELGQDGLEAVIEEMIKRGWIERAPKKSGPKVDKWFRVTHLGRRLGAESAHLFKWPAARSQVRPVGKHKGWLDCIVHLRTEMARLGRQRDDLAPYQQMMLRDIESGLDEEALSFMHDYWNYNLGAIAARGDYTIGHRPRPAPLRIELLVRITGRGNLAVEWYPTGLRLGKPTPDCDWVRWVEEKNRFIDFSTRPNNELLLVREMSYATRQFPGMFSELGNVNTVMVDAILLQAIAGLVEKLKKRLALNFAVHLISDVFMTWEEVESGNWPDGKADVLARWTIENVAKRNKTLELQELDQFQATYGCPLDKFVEALNAADAKRKTGPAPAPYTKNDRVSRALKAAGYPKITLGTVDRYRTLLERHMPELFPKPEAPSAEVLPFKAPNGANGTR